jgi:lantibiotic modifying enzyme
MKKPLLLQNNDLTDKIQKKLEEIVFCIKNIDNKDYISPGLFSGSAGIALFLFYYSKYAKDEFYESKAMSFLEHSIDSIGNSLNATFCSGISGIGWCIHHLISNGFIDEENIDIIHVFDKYLCEKALEYSSANYFDYLHGAIGIAVYLLKRTTNNNVLECEKEIITILNNSKKYIDNTCFWEYKIGNKNNISLSHGMASTCIFLSKAYDKLSIQKSITGELARKSIYFIINQEIISSNKISMFPTFSLMENNKNSLGSRLGWCYGDLGIALALWHYSQILQDNKIEQKAIDIFLFSSLRRDLNKNAIIDAGICHGTSGIALIFRKMYYYTKKQEFLEAALFWLNQTLLMSKYEDGIAGYKANQKTSSFDFLEGIAGIGLVLLSFLTNEDTLWDECLLLS